MLAIWCWAAAGSSELWFSPERAKKRYDARAGLSNRFRGHHTNSGYSMPSNLNRRNFLAALAATGARPLLGQPAAKPDFTLRIGAVEVEIAPKHFIKTTGYNGSFPGPPLRVPEGRPVTVAVDNDTSIPELVHWHGTFAAPEVDGAIEEGT